MSTYEPRQEKTCFRCVRPDKTSLLSYTNVRESWNCKERNYWYYTIQTANNKGADQTARIRQILAFPCSDEVLKEIQRKTSIKLLKYCLTPSYKTNENCLKKWSLAKVWVVRTYIHNETLAKHQSYASTLSGTNYTNTCVWNQPSTQAVDVNIRLRR